jgi:hypothetical protein
MFLKNFVVLPYDDALAWQGLSFAERPAGTAVAIG